MAKAKCKAWNSQAVQFFWHWQKRCVTCKKIDTWTRQRVFFTCKCAITHDSEIADLVFYSDLIKNCLHWRFLWSYKVIPCPCQSKTTHVIKHMIVSAGLEVAWGTNKFPYNCMGHLRVLTVQAICVKLDEKKNARTYQIWSWMKSLGLKSLCSLVMVSRN